MRTSSSIQSLCRWIRTPLLFFSSKNRFLNEPCNGFVFQGTKLSRKFRCHSLSSSDEPRTPITFPANLLELEEKSTSDSNAPKWRVLKEKAETFGLVYDDSCVPGCFYNLFCPKETLHRYLQSPGFWRRREEEDDGWSRPDPVNDFVRVFETWLGRLHRSVRHDCTLILFGGGGKKKL